MNQLSKPTIHRLRRAIDWKAMGWMPYDQHNIPFVGQTVEVAMSTKRVLVAVYDPKWDNGFCNLEQTEALPNRPHMWRPIAGNRKIDRWLRPSVEFVE